MSIIRSVIRFCTVAALRQRTLAESRVFDSSNTPLVTALEEDGPEQPYIVVYTDNDNRQNIDGMNLLHARRGLHLVIEMGVATKVTGEQNEVSIQIPATDAGFELSLDILELQVINALLHDANSPFGELLRTMLVDIERAPSMRGSGSQRGTKWAARQLTLITDTVDDFESGVAVPSGHPLRQFVDLVRQYPDLGMSVQADIIENLISASDAVYPTWQQIQSILATTKQGVVAIGQAPLYSEPTADELHSIVVQEEDVERSTTVDGTTTDDVID